MKGEVFLTTWITASQKEAFFDEFVTTVTESVSINIYEIRNEVDS
jgi:hypothetical protein